MRRLTPALAIFTLSLSLGFGPAPMHPAALAQTTEAGVLRYITVTGTSEVRVVPDMASISTGVLAVADTAAGALSEITDVSNALLEQIRGAGIDAADVQTSGLSVRPDYRETRGAQPSELRIAGFVASTDLNVTVRDLDALGPLMDTLVADGGANQLGGVSFGISDPKAAQNLARQAAVADALATAALLAEAAGTGLGAVISISDGAVPQPFPGPVMAEMNMMRSMEIAPGNLEVSARVTLVIELVTP